MIKVDLITNEDGSVSVFFESSSTDPSSLDKFDTLYQALVGSDYPKVGGYTFSNKFKIDVLIGKTEE